MLLEESLWREAPGGALAAQTERGGCQAQAISPALPFQPDRFQPDRFHLDLSISWEATFLDLGAGL